MKKLFTFFTALLLAGSMWADVTLYSVDFTQLTAQTVISSTTTTKTLVAGTPSTTLSFKGYKNSDVTISASGLKFTGNNIIASAGAASGANYYMAIPVSGVNQGQVTVTTTGDGTKWYYTYTTDEDMSTIVARQQASANGGFTISGLEHSDVTIYIGSSTKTIKTLTITTLDPVAETPAISAQPASANYNEGDVIAPLTVTASVSDGGELSYQWYEGEIAIVGATSASYTPTIAGEYHVVVTNSKDGCVAATATSSTATIAITPVNIHLNFYALGGKKGITNVHFFDGTVANTTWPGLAVSDVVLEGNTWKTVTVSATAGYTKFIVDEYAEGNTVWQTADLLFSTYSISEAGDYYFVVGEDGNIFKVDDATVNTAKISYLIPTWENLSDFGAWVFATGAYDVVLTDTDEDGWYEADVEYVGDSYSMYLKFNQSSDKWEALLSDMTSDMYFWNTTWVSDGNPKTFSVSSKATKPSNEALLNAIEYSNGFKAFVHEHTNDTKTIEAFYLLGQDAPTLVQAKTVASEGAQVVYGDGTVTVTSEDGTVSNVYTITVEAVTPYYNIAEHVFDGSEAWVKTGSDFYDGVEDPSKLGWLLYKNVDPSPADRRMPRGMTRIYFFVGAGGSVDIYPSSTHGSDRSIKYSVNGGEETVVTFEKYSSNKHLTIETGNAAMIEILVNQTAGNTYFGKIVLNPAHLALGTNGWSTFCAPFDFVYAGAQAFSATLNGDNTAVTLNAVDGNLVKAGEGIILKGAEGDDVTITPSIDAPAIAANDLVGVTVNTNLDANFTYYVLATEAGVTAFHPYDGAYIPAGKACLKVATAGAPERIAINSNPVATGVENVTATKAVKALVNGNLVIVRNGAKFNLNGMLVK